jgi:hypothetical protein
MSTQEISTPLGLAAVGSLPAMRARPSNGRRFRLCIELGLLFAIVPLAIAYALQAFRISVFLALTPVLLGVVVVLLCDRSFSLGREFTRGFGWRTLASIAAGFLLLGGAVSVWMWLMRPAAFLAFPLHRLELWTAVMLVYPLLSALPQELVYRTFFFHRYGAVFGDQRLLAVAVNGALFGFAHVIIGNGTAMILSGVLGLLLAYRYTEARSLWAVWIEHTLYGWLVFTVGLGRYFFAGVSFF